MLRHSSIWLCNPMDCSLPGSSLHGIPPERILEWVAIISPRGSSQPRDQTHTSYVSCIGRQALLLLVPPWKPHAVINWSTDYTELPVSFWISRYLFISIVTFCSFCPPPRTDQSQFLEPACIPCPILMPSILYQASNHICLSLMSRPIFKGLMKLCQTH